jgi:acyl-CoA reductase-like NAD-dependent aldehyde dehydrogenase
MTNHSDRSPLTREETRKASRPLVTEARAFYVAGRPSTGRGHITVLHPRDGSHVGDVSIPDTSQIESAVSAAVTAQGACEALSSAERARALDHISAQLARRSKEIAELITSENGKPIKWAISEVERAVATFRIAAEEARRFSGELMRLDTEDGARGRMAMIRRFSRGPVLAIAPFNFPLNLIAHKVAPAIAVGSPIIIKPAPATPLTALVLGEILAETELPEGSWSVLTVTNDQMPSLVGDPRLPVISFTGSAQVGWAIRDSVPRKHVTLELGGNAAAIVCSDFDSDGDLDFAATRIAQFGMYQAGQSCISVQQVLADRSVYEGLAERVVSAVRKQRTGGVWDPATDVGPLIDEQAALRVQSWVEEAVDQGAKVATGGRRVGSSYEPTVLTGVDPSSKVLREEIFGPVISLVPVDGLDDAFAKVNASRYGLQAGVFTHDLRVAFRAHRELQVGGVVIGDVPSFRADQMPYGGIKDSGIGREGITAAMQDLTYERVLVVNAL